MRCQLMRWSGESAPFLEGAPSACFDEALERRALQLGLELGHPVNNCFYLAMAGGWAVA